MFFSLFSSKDKKLVKKWKREHKNIVTFVHKIIASYSLNDKVGVQKNLVALQKLVLEHIVMEDIELNKLLQEDKNLSDNTRKMLIEFKKTFRETKDLLITFLGEYPQNGAKIDEKFFDSFNELVKAVSERISYEEENLYASLEKK